MKVHVDFREAQRGISDEISESGVFGLFPHDTRIIRLDVHAAVIVDELVHESGYEPLSRVAIDEDRCVAANGFKVTGTGYPAVAHVALKMHLREFLYAQQRFQ